MKSKRKLWVILTLACFCVGICFWLLTPNNVSKVSAASASTNQSAKAPARTTLHVSGRYEDLRFADAADLPENVSLSSINRPEALIRADINSDGALDLIATYTTEGGSELRVRVGNDLGTYEALPQTYKLTGGTAKAIATGDFNVDGFQDIVAVNSEAGSLSTLFGTEQGTFRTGASVKLSDSIKSLVAADINRDGIEDLVAINENNSSVNVLINSGDLSNSEIKTIKPRGLGRLSEVKVADFNNDFSADIVIATNSGVMVLYGDSKGNFGREDRLNYNNSVTGLVVADMNGDHFPDIVVSGSNGISLWNNRQTKGFSTVKTIPAGVNASGVVAGNFNGDDFMDLAVVNKGTGQVSVLVGKKGKDFSQPMAMDVDGEPTQIAAGNFRLNRIDGIAIAKNDGNTVLAVEPQAVTLQVSTLFDENDCPGCTSAQLRALKGPLGAPGGGTGISLREALTAINNDFVLSGTVNQGVGFSTLSLLSAANNANVETDVRSTCGATSNTYWFVFVTGDLPPILSPGTIIDGTMVNTSTTNGVNNTTGPEVVVSGGGFLVTSSAPNCVIKGLSIINAPNNAISVASNGNMITGNNIGLDCDTVTPGPNTLNGVLLSGASNATVSNNFIATNGLDGIQVNGISLAIPIPQNNTFDRNSIGINRLGFTVDPGTGSSVANLRDGIRVQAGATGNTITNSVISGNVGHGVNVSDNITSNTIIRSNRIGVDPSGQIAVGNGLDGVSISTLGNSKFNTVTQNLISGNGGLALIGAGNGVSITSGDAQAQFNVVSANRIGVNSTGSVQVPNFGAGLLMTGTANNNTIGGLQTASFNQIAGNGGVGIEIGGAIGLANPNNNLIVNNDIGPNNLGTGAPFDPLTPALNLPRSNKGGGIIIDGAAFSNIITLNDIAFNNDTAVGIQPNPPTTPPVAATSGITQVSTGNFNTFSANNIFLNPPDVLPVTPNITVATGNEGINNGQINNTVVTSLIKIDSAVTITSTGQTTIKGTANFLDNGILGNINNAVIEVFVSKRGSEVDQTQSEGQLFLNGVISFQPNTQNQNTVDWSASLSIPAPFLNPVQTNTVYLTATITTGDGSTSPFSIGLVPQFVSGVGQCTLNVNPTTVTFTNTPVGTTAQQMVTLTNSGQSLITVTGLSFANGGNSQFAVSGASVPFTLAAGGTQTLTVSFTPNGSTTGSQTATLNIANSCTGTSSVNVTGTACRPNLTATPNPVNFGTVQVGLGASMTVTVGTTGCNGSQVVTFTAALGANTPAAFSIARVNNNVITVNFNPTAAGTFNGSLVITSTQAGNSPLTVPLMGMATAPSQPVLRVNPANVIFGDVPVNTTATQSVTITNVGNATLNVSTPAVQTGASLGFSVSQPPRLSLPPNESTTFQVSFRPTQTGQATGTILVSSDGGSQTIQLSGNGTAATISVPQQSVDFGTVVTGTTSSRSVVITNTGTAPLNVASLSVTGGASGFSLPNNAGFTVNPNSSSSITVNFTPTTSGPKTDVLVINSNDPSRPVVNVTLAGSGSDTTPPTVSVQSPAGGEGFGNGTQFTVRFTASDNTGVSTFEVRLSTNGGSSFDISLGSGVAQNGSNSFTAVAPPGVETSQARVQVLVRDAANNVGQATSGANFAIGQAPVLLNPVIKNGKFTTFIANSNIQTGAVLVIGNETFALTTNNAGTKFVVKKSTTGSNGNTLRQVAPSGSTVTVSVRNPNGIASSPATINAQ